MLLGIVVVGSLGGIAMAACESGWFSHNTKCYVLVPSTMNWPTCASYCADLGATMLCLETSNQNEYVHKAISRESGRNIWLGYNDRYVEGTWEWQAGCTSSFANFRVGEPNNAGDQDCARMRQVDGTWDDCQCSSCAEPTYCTCEKMEPTSVNNGCPAEAVKLNGHCYYVHFTRVNQPTCKSICASRGATLPCIESSAENTALPTLLNDQFWIGYEKINGVWQRPHGCDTSYTKWYSNEPIYNCAYSSYWHSPFWQTANCNTGVSSCMCDHGPPVTSPTVSPSPAPIPSPSPAPIPSPSPPPVPLPSPVPTLPETLSPSMTCPDDTIPYDTHCFHMNYDWFTYDECNEYCRNRAANMPCMETKREHKALDDYANSHYWIGYSTRYGEWNWENGCESRLKFWYSSEPQIISYDQCAFSFSSQTPTWGETECNSRMRCMCEHGDPIPYESHNENEKSSSDTTWIVVGCSVGGLFVLGAILWMMRSIVNKAYASVPIQYGAALPAPSAPPMPYQTANVPTAVAVIANGTGGVYTTAVVEMVTVSHQNL